jgi:hypothetical protein
MIVVVAVVVEGGGVAVALVSRTLVLSTLLI